MGRLKALWNKGLGIGCHAGSAPSSSGHEGSEIGKEVLCTQESAAREGGRSHIRIERALPKKPCISSTPPPARP
eukprot:9501247-Pyramimonas_sp.AAC.1